MDKKLEIEILPQPDDTTCGPTCLHAVYRYYGDEVLLQDVIAGVKSLEEGGTMAVLLALHALHRGYRASIYTYNLNIFDPTWFGPDAPDLGERLARRLEYKDIPKQKIAIHAYLEFLKLGGRIFLEDLRPALIRRFLNHSIPILTGLSNTYLYRSAREYGPRFEDDDIRGDPGGHFVILSGYNREEKKVLVADPYLPNPIAGSHYYPVDIHRVITAILLGIVTYDANLLIIEPPRKTHHAG
jgi:hypothetical protein